MRIKKLIVIASLVAVGGLIHFTNISNAADWSRFRGPNGLGIAEDASDVPTQWSASANLGWKIELPGPGVSSPIIVGDKVFVTCYSGYGLERENPGDINNLMRHLICLNLQDGKILWQKDIEAVQPEDPYTGVGVTAHGYASHTPVSDGERVYFFLGKSGVYAYTLDGKELWNAKVGMESDPAKWGSSSSPILADDKVIIVASAEGQAVIAFDKNSGNELWRQEASGLDNMWGTPAIVEGANGSELVMVVAKEIWALDPASGKMRWMAKATEAEQSYTSIIAEDDKIIAMTGRGGGSVAIKPGGSGDISETNTLWEGRETASFASPVSYDGRIYSISRGLLTIINADSGAKVGNVRLKGALRTGGRFGSLDYASPIVVGDRLFYLNGSGQMFVFNPGDKPEQIAVNRVTQEAEMFGGTPAVSQGRLVLRSDKHIYCVVNKGEEVTETEMMTEVDENDEADDGQRRGGNGRPGANGRPGRPGGNGRPGGRGGDGQPGGGQRQQRTPLDFFNGLDSDGDKSVTFAELEGNRMADRLKTLDKDGDESISQEEFTSGIGSLFRGGGGRGGRRQSEDNRPKRPQRPEMIDA